MVHTALAYGVVLVTLGIGGYFGSGRVSLTALIPCVFGLPVIVLAITARVRPHLSQHMMHGALAITLLALLGTAPALLPCIRLIAGETVDRPPAIIAKSVMALLSLAFLGLGTNNFITIRRRRKTN